MKHIKLEIKANEYQQEELIALLDDYQPTGFEQTEESLIAYFADNSFQAFNLKDIMQGYDFELSQIDEKNWNEEWEQNFHPIRIGQFVAVRADFHQAIDTVQHEIIITPKMSFGTGHHATTHMMLEQMEEINFENTVVFDFGTGTGILAILAEKLGAKLITAIDVDDWSIENASENAAKNNCVKIDFALTSQLPASSFDIILANINRNVLLDYMNQLTSILKHGGKILMSGLLAEDEEAISLASAAAGFSFLKRSERQGWLSLLFAKA